MSLKSAGRVQDAHTPRQAGAADGSGAGSAAGAVVSALAAALAAWLGDRLVPAGAASAVTAYVGRADLSPMHRGGRDADSPRRREASGTRASSTRVWWS